MPGLSLRDWRLRTGLLIALLVLFRAPIFRCLVHYEPLQTIAIPLITHSELLEQIKTDALALADDNLASWVNYAQGLTAKQLQFRVNVQSSDPNQVWQSGQAHCIGYAALMGTILKTILMEKKKLGPVRVEQVRADIYILGIRLTGPSRPAFFRDHDYIRVTDQRNNEQMHCDPGVYDYFRIKRVQ